MASVTSDFPADAARTKSTARVRVSASYGLLAVLGSLKFTVTLFALSLILVLVGTLAQDQMNMQEVKERYFLSWIAPLHIDDFFPQAFYRHDTPIPGVVPFTGGALIGVLLMVNLIAAKITRFRLKARGGRLLAGLAFLALGIAIAAVVVFLGHNDDGLQGTPPAWLGYNRLWGLILATLAIGSVASAVAGQTSTSVVMKRLGWITGACLAIAVVACLFTGFRIGEPGLRIVWQLAKGLGAGLVMLVGCQIAFGKQGGNVLLHLGVGLLMVGQFAFGDRQTEQRLSLVEGQSTNTFVNLDQIELQLIRSEDDEQTVTAIPSQRLLDAAREDSLIEDPALPVKIRVRQYFENSSLIDVPETNLATKGVGLEVAAVEKDKSGGAKMEMNTPSAYIEVIDPDSGESLGTFLASHSLNDRAALMPDGKSKDMMDSFTVGGIEYEFGLRLQRQVKPYWVQLDDVRRTTWSGSQTPRDFSSFIRIVDNETGEDRKARVWMNNPLRYRGETFYQSNYDQLPDGTEFTGIQVVRNSGWLIPYVACSVTALGMLVHFWGTLARFVARRRRETSGDSTTPFESDPFGRFSDEELSGADAGITPRVASSKRGPGWLVPLWVSAVTLLVATLLIPASTMQNMRRPTERDAKFDFAAAGKIPVQYGGRVMPLDAYARQTLKAMTNKDSLPLDGAPVKLQDRVDDKKMSAVQWLMEVAIDTEEIRRLPMFRIDSEEVRAELDLARRQSKLYSLQDIGNNLDRFTELVREAGSKDSGEQSFQDKKLIELDLRTRQYTVAAASFRLPTPDVIPAEFFPEGTSEQDRTRFVIRRLEERMDSLRKMNAPAIIPPPAEEAASKVNQPKWTPFAPAFFDMVTGEMRQMSLPEEARTADATLAGIRTFGDMIRAYGDEDTAEFNKAVDEHLAGVKEYPIQGYDLSAVSLERWLGGKGPDSLSILVYVLAFIIGLIGIATNSRQLNSAAWGTIAVAFIVHTVVIVSRVYITGRAPVINLYSSAVFIGWAAVLFGLVIERIFRYGTGNLLAAFSGFMTMMVADYLTLNVGSAETMGVLQAVLDTQFWLSTHVITVSLGYVATLVAGMLGIGYLIGSWCGASDRAKRDLYRVIYGATCFGILFSFVGTVLGGLWADDSWGRFWGWDPKENGALLIVIWNALMLHARWDGMVKATGFAILAIGGNIVTAWSWFGTNELGIGLHSYGFTEGMLQALGYFFAVQMVFIVAGMVVSLMTSSGGPKTKTK